MSKGTNPPPQPSGRDLPNLMPTFQPPDMDAARERQAGSQPASTKRASPSHASAKPASTSEDPHTSNTDVPAGPATLNGVDDIAVNLRADSDEEKNQSQRRSQDTHPGQRQDLSSDESEGAEKPTYPLLAEPSEGVPDVVTSAAALSRCCAAIRAGTGPVAIDAERASGYTYGNDAYLVQLRREGAGTWLIDPVTCPDLRSLNNAIGQAEWVLHAATQDLPCLRALGLHPKALFDTELGSRLAGIPRVGLAAVTEHYVGVTLAKEHSAADWSTRPLPHDWLTYASLDVELLVEVRNALAADLKNQGKDEWARQEFAHLLTFEGPAPKKDPWRKTSGIHGIRDPRELARVQALWQERDDIAKRRNTSPGRVLPDALIIDLAIRNPQDPAQLVGSAAIRPQVKHEPGRRRRPRPPHRGLARYSERWLNALQRANALKSAQLPKKTLRTSAPPPVRQWADKNPVAAARYEHVRASLEAFSQERNVPVENLITPDILRRTIWQPPADTSATGWRSALVAAGARTWQQDIVVPFLCAALEAEEGKTSTN